MSYTLGDFQLNLIVDDERTNMQIVGKVGEDSVNAISLKVYAIISTRPSGIIRERDVWPTSFPVTHYLTT